MSPTVTVEHLASVTTVSGDFDDMKIYQFDREASMDGVVPDYWCTDCIVGPRHAAYDEVLAA